VSNKRLLKLENLTHKNVELFINKPEYILLLGFVWGFFCILVWEHCGTENEKNKNGYLLFKFGELFHQTNKGKFLDGSTGYILTVEFLYIIA
jgi:hypothetical protein